MTVQLLVYVITTLFTYILGKISKHFGWNETLPIPIQNIDRNYSDNNRLYNSY